MSEIILSPNGTKKERPGVYMVYLRRAWRPEFQSDFPRRRIVQAIAHVCFDCETFPDLITPGQQKLKLCPACAAEAEIMLQVRPVLIPAPD